MSHGRFGGIARPPIKATHSLKAISDSATPMVMVWYKIINRQFVGIARRLRKAMHMLKIISVVLPEGSRRDT